MKKSFKFGLKIAQFVQFWILVSVLQKDQKYHNFQNIEFAIKERLNHVASILNDL